MKSKIKVFLLGIAAGACIAFGGLLNLLSITYLPAGAGKLIGALMFPLGLMIICVYKLNLYTGKIGFATKNRNYLDLIIMLTGNLTATTAIGLLSYLCLKETEIYAVVTRIYTNKLLMSSGSMIWSAALCGMLVFIGVKGYNNCTNKAVKLMIIELAIAIFVYLGFDHCVADMYYFAFGNYLKPEAAEAILNVVVGNSIGSIVTYKILE